MRQKWQVRRGWIKAVITVDVEKKKILDIEVFEKGDSEPDIFERHINGLANQGVQIRKACADGAHDKRWATEGKFSCVKRILLRR
ncbi:MAG: hypothetical protein HY929_05505 [Euryarchaeota archaeon]|nr:hypothetical protein [Euryarchaeota archaeon]